MASTEPGTMNGLLAGIWRSRLAAAAVGLVISVVVASVLYAFNWHTFYDTQRNLARAGAERLAEDVRDLVHLRAEGAGGAEVAVERHIERRSAHVSVVLHAADDGPPIWDADNGGEVDADRTRLAERFEWRLEGGRLLEVQVLQGIRPPLRVALWRAWTFSAAEYTRDPDGWTNQHLYNRSLPLYGYLLTVLVVGFGTVRALHRDQLELDRTHTEARVVTAELGELRDVNRRETASLRTRVEATERERDDAERERTRLDEEIAAVEREFDAATRGQPPDRVDDERLRAIKSKKSRMERAVAEHQTVMQQVEDELRASRGELSAAEDLLAEVETQHEDLEEKLRDRNREIRRLKELVDDARRDARDVSTITSQRISRQTAQQAMGHARHAELERQLEHWIEPHEGARINFSDHSRTGSVEAFFEKLDRAFVDRFFTHVTNPEYERGARRIMRVQSTPPRQEDDRGTGEIVIALDDDAGRTLGLRYELSKGAPEPSLVGFVLALLLRAGTRELARYPVRVR